MELRTGDLTEFATCGYEMLKGNTMYLVFNIWSGQETLRFADMVSKAEKVTLLGRNEELFFEQKEDVLYIHGLPARSRGAAVPGH